MTCLRNTETSHRTNSWVKDIKDRHTFEHFIHHISPLSRSSLSGTYNRITQHIPTIPRRAPNVRDNSPQRSNDSNVLNVNNYLFYAVIYRFMFSTSPPYHSKPLILPKYDHDFSPVQSHWFYYFFSSSLSVLVIPPFFFFFYRPQHKLMEISRVIAGVIISGWYSSGWMRFCTNLFYRRIWTRHGSALTWRKREFH